MQHKRREVGDVRKPKRAGNISHDQGSNAALPRSVCVCSVCAVVLYYAPIGMVVKAGHTTCPTLRTGPASYVSVPCVKLSPNFDRGENMILPSLDELCWTQSSSL